MAPKLPQVTAPRMPPWAWKLQEVTAPLMPWWARNLEEVTAPLMLQFERQQDGLATIVTNARSKLNVFRTRNAA